MSHMGGISAHLMCFSLNQGDPRAPNTALAWWVVPKILSLTLKETFLLWPCWVINVTEIGMAGGNAGGSFSH